MTPGGRDLGPTWACGLDWCCENCGAETDDLDVETAQVPNGVYCLTLCRACAEDGEIEAPQSWPEIAQRIREHCGHLGIDLDQMAEQLAAEEQR